MLLSNTPLGISVILLDSMFIDEDALKGYATHPAHVAVANERVRPYAEIRLCLDYEL